MARLELAIPEAQDRLIEKLKLSSDQTALIEMVREDGPVREGAHFEIVGGSFEHGGKIATDLEGVDAKLSMGANAGLGLAIYTSGDEVVLGDLDLPPLLDSRATHTVPEGKVACGFEVDAGVKASAGATGGATWRFAMDAAGEASARLAFIKEFPASTRWRKAKRSSPSTSAAQAGSHAGLRLERPRHAQARRRPGGGRSDRVVQSGGEALHMGRHEDRTASGLEA